ncbi:MAG: YrbL family protein [Akkermansiaceae bacterium]|nr:YrbL family protein [Akkermansiaceae bacterium]
MRAPDHTPVSLAGHKSIAKGRMRLVYRHPEDPGLLIKVIRPEVIPQRWGEGQPWYKCRRRYRQYISFIRECEEFIAGCAGGKRAVPFAQKITGFVETDLGLGLVMEAVLDEDGNLAPTLSTLVYGKEICPKMRAELDVFLEDLIASDLILADLNPENIVRGAAPGGGHRFVVIDGLGLSTILPFKFIPAINRASKRKRARDLWKRLERFSRIQPKS